MSAAQWELLMSTPDEVEIHEVKEVLEAEGIASRLEHDPPFPIDGHGGKGGEFRLFVDPADMEASTAILEELAVGEDDERA